MPTYPYTTNGIATLVLDLLQSSEKNISQLARSAQIAPLTLYKLLNHKAHLPRRYTVERLLRASGLSYEITGNAITLHKSEPRIGQTQTLEQFAEDIKQLIMREGYPQIDERTRRRVYEVVAALVKK